MSSLKRDIIKGTIWSILGQLGSLIVVLGTNIWLARMMSPTEFGQLGIVMFFIILSSVLTEGGLAGALVRKSDVTEEDYSTVFIFNFIVSATCYLVLVGFSGLIANFYNNHLLRDLLIVSGTVLIINAFQIVQNVKMVRKMEFKEKSLYRLISVVLASTIGIILAYKGLGVWALVTIQILISLFSTILLSWHGGVYIKWKFSKASFKQLYSFGVNTSLASLINTSFDNIYQLILGRYFSIVQVGLYYQAKKILDVPGSFINMLTQSVVFSSLSKLQDDRALFTKTFNRIVLISVVLLGLTSSLIFLYSEDIIKMLFGMHWLKAAFYMKFLSIASFFYYQEMFNLVIFKVFNVTRQILYLEIIKKTIQCISIFIGIYYTNLEILIYGFVITSFIQYGINFYFARKVLNTGFNEILHKLAKVILIIIICSLIFATLIKFLSLEFIARMLLVPFFIIFYLFLVKILGVLNIINEIRHIRKN